MRHSFKLLLSVLLFIMIRPMGPIQAQDTFTLLKSDTTTSTFKKKPWYIPLAEVTAINVLVNRFDVYYLKADWAKISLSSWKTNLKRGFAPDGDAFINNFFMHPVHGSMYFNTARSAGYNFWASSAYTLTGSLMWEFLGETYAASEIDVNTTLQGGMFLGEVAHRLSKALLRDNQVRPHKFFRNAAATVLNPMGQINRWMYDDVRESFMSDDEPAIPIRSQLSFGLTIPTVEFDRVDALASAYVYYAMLYGDIFDTSDGFRPFDSFVLRSWVDFGASAAPKVFYLNITSRAPLYAKRITDNSVFSISQHYDYLDNQAFTIGVTGLTLDYTLRQNYKSWGFVGSINAGIIPFGSSSSTVLDEINTGETDINREYVYGRGLLGKFEYMIYHKSFGRLTVTTNQWYINTENFVEGTELSAINQVNYYFPIKLGLDVGISALNYDRTASYQDIEGFEDINESYNEIKLHVTKTF